MNQFVFSVYSGSQDSRVQAGEHDRQQTEQDEGGEENGLQGGARQTRPAGKRAEEEDLQADGGRAKGGGEEAKRRGRTEVGYLLMQEVLTFLKSL